MIGFASSKFFFSKGTKIKFEFFVFGKGDVLEVMVEAGLLAGNALWAILLLISSCFTGVDVFYR